MQEACWAVCVCDFRMDAGGVRTELTQLRLIVVVSVSKRKHADPRGGWVALNHLASFKHELRVLRYAPVPFVISKE